MVFWRCLALLWVVACGSPHVTPVEPPSKPVAPQPVAAKPVAIVFVVEGWEMWVGNDQLQDVPETERYMGVLKPFKDAFAVTGLPAGSQAAVVTYTDHGTVRHPMAPIEKLSAAAFGEQKDYAGVIDRNLVAGVTLGLDELAKVHDARRVLVVISDGTDTNLDTAKAAFTALAARAAAENVKVVSLVYKAALSSPGTPLGAFDPNMLRVMSVDALANELAVLYEELAPQPVVGGGSGVALTLLVSGAEVWMGNDDIVPADDPSRYTGALKPIRAAVERSPMTGFPAGSQGAVLKYDDTVQTQRRWGPIEKLDARALGDQQTYYGRIGTELVSGVRTAFAQLAKVNAARRVLIILGDGSDTNNDAAKAQLLDLAKQAAELHIEVHAIIYKGQLSSEGTVIKLLDPKASTATSADEITTQLAALLRGVRS